MSTSRQDRFWMRRCLALARRRLGATQPNPLVGAIVLNRNGEKVAEAFHEKAGLPHAEVLALHIAGERSEGGTLYVNLEPCVHEGKTPPCVEAIIQSKTARVVPGMLDPNPKVSGKGFAKLKKHSIDVAKPVLENECLEINRPFAFFMEHARPMVTAKIALTSDGVVGRKSRRLVISDPSLIRQTMRLRAEAGAILVGVNTVLADDPRLNVRGHPFWNSPLRLVLDPSLKTNPASEIFSSPGDEVHIFSKSNAPKERISVLEKVGANVHLLNSSKNFSPDEILTWVKNTSLHSILLEGGSETIRRFYEAGKIDRFFFYLSDRKAPKMSEEEGVRFFSEELFEKLQVVQKAEKKDFPLEFKAFRLVFQSAIRRGDSTEIRAASF